MLSVPRALQRVQTTASRFRIGFRAAPPRIRSAMACAASDGKEVVAVYVTVPSRDEGERIAGQLVRSKLAACCNIIPGLTSIYEWEGKICTDSELLLMIKSTRGTLPALTAAVQTEHSYDECEVIAVPVVGGSQSYIDWVAQSVQDKPAQ